MQILLIFFLIALCINYIKANESLHLFYGIDSNFIVVDLKNTTEKAQQLLIKDSNFQFIHQELSSKSPLIAACKYEKIVNQTGWNFLQVITNSNFTDYEQGFAAGKCEGAVSQEHIFNAYQNYVNSSVLEGKADLPPKTLKYIKDQFNWMKDMVQTNGTNDNYWGVLGVSIKQIEGMYSGYSYQVEKLAKTEQILDFFHFYYLTYMGDMGETLAAFKEGNITTHTCNAFVRYTGSDLYVAHNTFNIYQLMLRIFKVYKLNLNNPLVVNKHIQFSARPGDLESKDDFYTFNDMVVTETSLLNWNATNNKFLHSNSLPCWIRVISANKVSSQGRQWAKYFGYMRSGTHNNQWFVVDYKAFRNKQLQGIVYMAEESYYLYEQRDFTSILLARGYVAGYNVPFHQNIFDADDYGVGLEGFTYTSDPRAQLFDKYSKHTRNLTDIQNMLYMNQNNTGNTCGVPPSLAVASELAPRCDLVTKGPFTYGLIDGKIVNNALLKERKVSLRSSPTTEGLPPFSWSQFPDQLHEGMPGTWNFDWYLYDGLNGKLQNQTDSYEQLK